MTNLLALIVLAPLAGFLANGLLATQLRRQPFGNRFVTIVGCGLPIISFLLAARATADLLAGGSVPLVETAYTWTTIDGHAFNVDFYFDRLSSVMTLVRLAAR
jgi:NADH:ubiquinone oxidoreductase subunit 5 (subunit L)/multisubunit Na+/H+ antiporter MnhA subunit